MDCDLWSISESMEDEEFPGDLDYGEVVDAAYDLFRSMKIGTSNAEEPHEVCMTDDGEILGASVAGYRGGEEQDEDGYPILNATFSVVVAPAGRRRGIARKLVESIVEHFRQDAGWREATVIIEPEVVNPHMAALLRSLGFSENAGGWSERDPYMTLAVE